jgi:hypothetical protein
MHNLLAKALPTPFSTTSAPPLLPSQKSPCHLQHPPVTRSACQSQYPPPRSPRPHPSRWIGTRDLRVGGAAASSLSPPAATAVSSTSPASAALSSGIGPDVADSDVRLSRTIAVGALSCMSASSTSASTTLSRVLNSAAGASDCRMRSVSRFTSDSSRSLTSCRTQEVFSWVRGHGGK